MKIEFSWRYCVMGVYRDRGVSLTFRGKSTKWRVYPVPFVRASFTVTH